MPEPSIVTPQEAEAWIQALAMATLRANSVNLAHTVATEPDRTRAAVVQALRDEALRFGSPERRLLEARADAIEAGAGW